MFIGSGGRRGRAALVLLAALMVAGTLGGAAAYLVSRGKAGIPGGPRLGHADELRLVPGTAVGFIHVRWRDARRAPGAADLRQIIEKASPHAKAALDPSSSLDPATIDRATVVYLRGAEPPPAKALLVGIARVRAGHDALLLGQSQRGEHGVRVAGMAAARHIGAADQSQHRCVIAHRPRTIAFAKVGVEVDRPHAGTLAWVPRVMTRSPGTIASMAMSGSAATAA